MIAEAIEILAERVRDVLKDRPISTKRMFGGITFLLNGNMLCCASKNGLMIRVGAAAEEAALTKPHAARCLGAGRPMAGFILVGPSGITRDADLNDWVHRALAYVELLPPKKAKTALRRQTKPVTKSRKE